MTSVEEKLDQANQYHQNGRWQKAAALYQEIIENRSNHPEALHGLGIIAYQQNNYDRALDFINQAIAQKPDMAQFYYNLGLVLIALAEPHKAIAAFNAAIGKKGDYAEAYYNLGNVFKALGKFDEAVENYRQVIAIQPQFVEAHYNLGNALKVSGCLEEAMVAFQECIRLMPKFPDAYNNLGLVLKEQGRPEAAIGCYTRAIKLKPDFAEAHWNRSLAHLLNGNYKEGWKEYEWRFRRGNWQRTLWRPRSKSTWDGSTFEGRQLLVYAEQGFGDTLQFVRFLPIVKARGGTVILEARRALHGLLEGFSGVDRLVDSTIDGTRMIDCDLSVPLLSLPRIFKTELETIPGAVPYIFASDEKVSFWKKRLGKNGFRVGVVWAGRREHKNDRNRSCPLEHFIPLAGINGVQLYGLQKGVAALEVANLPARLKFTNLGEDFENFSDTAGAIENLDLVISVDTAVAHLAGAMGKPVWLLLPYAPDWRWLLNRKDSPWYPTMRLFRQKTSGDWDLLFDRVMNEIMLAKAEWE